MTKEQEEAIERLKYLIIDLKSSKKVNEIVTKEGKFNLVKDLETVLSMLKEKDKEIEFQKDIRNTEKNRHKKTEKSLKGIINKQNTELAEKNAEIEKLNRQIDFMAEQLAGLTIWDNEKEEPLILTDKEEVKQYIERKVTNNG